MLLLRNKTELDSDRLASRNQLPYMVELVASKSAELDRDLSSEKDDLLRICFYGVI